MFTGFLKGLTLLLGLTVISTAHASDPQRREGVKCYRYSAIKDNLAREYDEHSTFYGKVDDGRIFQMLLNEKTGTWSVLVINRNGIACMVASGEGGVNDRGH